VERSNTAAIAAKNYKQLGMTMPVLCSNAITIPSFIKAAGDIAEEKGWVFFTLPFPKEGTLGKKSLIIYSGYGEIH
jgi:hypothetical protein